MVVLKHCTNEQLQEWAATQWEQLKTYLQQTTEFLPAEHRSLGFEDGGIQLLGGSVTIVPQVYQAKSIGGIREMPGWEVSSWKHEPETEYYPADFVPVEEKQTTSTLSAAVVATKLAFEILLDDWASREHDKQAAGEVKEWKDQGLI
jgi:hypothetical protein